jgi:hypothetical protein
LRVDGRITAGGLDAGLAGTASMFADNPSAALRATIARADVAPLRGAAGGRAALPVAFAARIGLAGNEWSFSDMTANIGGTSLRGKVGVTLPRPYRIQGDIEADAIDGAGLIASAIGMPPSVSSSNTAWAWSSEPFTDGAFGEFAGQVAVKARRLDLSPRLTAREFRATLRLGSREFTFDDMSGDLAGGRLSGQLAFRSAGTGMTMRAKVSVGAADAAVFGPAAARPPMTGALTFSADVEGTGLSPVALIGSLQGTGKFALANGQFAALDPRAFDAVTRAVDQGLVIDARRISDVATKAMDSGQLSIKQMDGTVAISAGQIRLSNVAAESKDAALALAGNLDLTDGSVDARLVLSGTSEAAGARPDIFMALKGPVAAPSRSIDVSALTGWLTLRAVDNQAKKLQSIEDEAKRVRALEDDAKRLRESESAVPRSGELAPALPAPVDVKPLPAPARSRQPAASVGPQN